jgi:hypothetical protein
MSSHKPLESKTIPVVAHVSKRSCHIVLAAKLLCWWSVERKFHAAVNL